MPVPVDDPFVIRNVTPEEHEWLKQGKCPYCTTENWRLGPAAGLSQNIYCGTCDARFNIPAFFTPEVIKLPSSLGRGIIDAQAGRLIDLGSFKEYM